MVKVRCSVSERYVNPLFEVFDGGDLILSSWRDVEEPLAEMRIFVEAPERVADARACLQAALDVVGAVAEIGVDEVADEDWKFAYRRHFKTELVSRRILVQPEWEEVAVIRFDPGLAFGTGRHETTKACLQYIDELAAEMVGGNARGSKSFLDMGCGSGILSIAAAKLGFGPVHGFDVDPEAVTASVENAARNGVEAQFRHFALGRPEAARPECGYDLVAANILGPLLIRFAGEIEGYVRGHLIVSGILNGLYPEVVAAYSAFGFTEASHKTLGEWTTGLLTR